MYRIKSKPFLNHLKLSKRYAKNALGTKFNTSRGETGKNLLATFRFPKQEKTFFNQICLSSDADDLMLYKNTKSLVRSPDGEVSVLPGDTLTPYFFVITLDFVLKTFLDKFSDLGPTLSEKAIKKASCKKDN